MLDKIPAGLDQIIKVFGSLDDPHFEQNNIVLFDLPYPLTYDGQPVKRARAHRLAVDHFVAAFKAVQAAGLHEHFTEFNGIYNRRAIRGQSAHPSLHSWGAAIDMCASKIPLGSSRRLPQGVIDAFKAAGFFYGGDFVSRKDGMHFQLATHY